jgi:acetyl esterase/lipase
MMQYVLLGLSLLLAGVALLTAVKAPTVATWRMAVLAGEFGHFLMVLPLGLAVWVVTRGPGEGGVILGATLVACAVATGLLLKPSVQARRVAMELPERLERAFGKVDSGREAFSVRGFFATGGAEVSAETRVFAHGGTEDVLSLDFYRARGRTGAPCVVVVHGGGWDSGDRSQMADMNAHLARRGFAVAAVSYRLAPKHVWPAQREDVQAALAYLKSNAGELGIDPERFVLLGRSAGGQIAESVAYDRPDPAVRGVIALYAPADLHFAWSHTPERDVLDSKKLMRQLTGGTPETAAANFESASPYLHARGGAVPTLLMHGKIDSLVWYRQSERLAEKLRGEGVPCLFVELPWATHAFDYTLRGPGGQLSTFAIEWFVEAVTARERGSRE